MSDIERELRRYLQQEFYLGNKTDGYATKLQQYASAWMAKHYPSVGVTISVNYFGDITIKLN